MKKGHDIKEVVQKINNDVQYKKDYIVTLNALQINKSEKVFPNVQITDCPTQYNLTDHSLNQLFGRLEIGTHYINKCLPVSQDLVAHNLNFWINKTKSRELMIRTFQNDSKLCRAIMSNRYKRIDNDLYCSKKISLSESLHGFDFEFK